MIPIVENVLLEIIESRLKAIKSNPDIVDRIFRQAPMTMRNRIKEYLRTGKILVTLGYPKDRASVPAFAIMLGGEREQDKSIGDYIGDEDATYASTTETQKVVTHNGRLAVRVNHKPIEAVMGITDLNGIPINFEVSNAQLGYIEIFEGEAELNEYVEVSYTYADKGVETYGAIFSTQYRVETWTDNGDLTVYLYHLLKWILLSSRPSMSEKGLNVQTLGGMDLEPLTEYMPSMIYRRALTFESSIDNDYEVEYDFIQEIAVENTSLEGR